MSFWQRKHVLVTGGNGLIGAPLCYKLLQEGAAVTVYDTATRGMLERFGISLRDIHFFKDTILAFSRLKAAIRDQDVVFHLAAISGVEQSRVSMVSAFEVNVRGTWLVLQGCLEEGRQEAIVVASSNHIYGDHRGELVPEGSTMEQLDTYSATKTMADYAARAYAHNYALPVAVVRNTNCFGPHDPHHDHIVPGTINSLLRGETPVIRGRGVTKKSYLYVDDVVDAYLHVAEWQAHSHIDKGRAFNVADEPVSVLSLVNLISAVMSATRPPVIMGEADDQSDENLDSSLIRKVVGWKPRHTLREGLEKTVAGFRSRA